MLNRIRAGLTVILLLALAANRGKALETINTNVLRKQQLDRIHSFFVAKEKQAKAIAAKENQDVLPEIETFFRAGLDGKWETATNLESQLFLKRTGDDKKKPDEKLARAPYWQLVLETGSACQQVLDGTPRFIEMWEHDIIESIPPGSIYFGGTDPGRFLISAFSKSHRDGEPFFTLTQNAFADRLYLEYVGKMYGEKLKMLSAEDSARAFQEYLADAQKRLKRNELKPGEEVTSKDGQVQVSGQVAVMAINALMVKMIVDRNPDRQIFVEESFPLDWTYPYLEPHGPIMKLNHKPLPEISDEMIQQDRAYWHPRVREMIGDWLVQSTSVQEITEFSTRVYFHTNLTDFKGDKDYALNDSAQKMFSKLRSSIGGVYAWRAANAKTKNEKERMERAADFVFRQALALCPYSPEAVYRYVQLLVGQSRMSDAILVASTCLKLDPTNPQMQTLLKQLQAIAKNR